jgi:hydroxymethylpyrimidine pyrophosphatase-like HAD family hydrolase
VPFWFRAVALDYDGTLTEGDRPPPDALDAIREFRRDGRRAVLVTGRILADLRRIFPGVDAEFDAIVAENGAVLARDGGAARRLAPRVPTELADALLRRGVPVVEGEVLLATRMPHDGAVLEEIARLGLEAQIARNRGELMVLPPGVSKGTGARHALGALGVSIHSAIGVGDAENDHSLLEACELGVAVGNAIEPLKAHADVVLREPAGAGVAALLRGPLVGGEIRVHPRRWQAELGRLEDGSPARIPASQVNVLVSGGSGAGKSHLAGLLAERLVELGYSLCVLDPEGDHLALGGLPGVLTVGGSRSRRRRPSVASCATASAASSSICRSPRARRPGATPGTRWRSCGGSATRPGSPTGSSSTRRTSPWGPRGSPARSSTRGRRASAW